MDHFLLRWDALIMNVKINNLNQTVIDGHFQFWKCLFKKELELIHFKLELKFTLKNLIN